MKKRRHWIKMGFAIVLMLCVSSGAQAVPKRVKPDTAAGTVKIMIGGKSYTYYRTQVGKPVEFRVLGPTPVRILSRHLYREGSKTGRATYRYRVEVDGVLLKTITQKSGASARAFLKDGAKIGGLDKAVVRIPAGNHTVRIVPAKGHAPIALRLYLDSGKKATGRWIPFCPTYI
jgi:hypothetical protein